MSSQSWRKSRLVRLFVLAVFGLLVACADSPIKRAEELAAQDEWLKAVLEYRKATANNPGDVEVRSRLKRSELKAADFYYQGGQRLLEQGNLDAAIVQYQQGLASMPDHGKLQQAMNEAIARTEAGRTYREPVNLLATCMTRDAGREFARTLDIYPANPEAAAALVDIHQQYH